MQITLTRRRLRALVRLMQPRAARLVLAIAAVGMLTAMGYALRPAPLAKSDITVAQDPGTLSDADRSIYSAIFDALSHHDTTTVAGLIPQIGNPVLLGHVLASQYLADSSKPSDAELAQWLQLYRDHNEAPRIAALARSRGMDVAALDAEKPLKGDGNVFHLGRTTMPDRWYEGLRLWKDQEYGKAASIFTAIGNDDGLNDWQRSAGSYWAYRSLLQTGDRHAAGEALASAADEPLTFYGQLALAREGKAMPVRAQAPEVSYRLRADGHVARARAFTALGMDSAAELELRNLYGQLDPEDRPALATLAAEMNLPNLQVRMAQLPQLDEAGKLFAEYPTPGDMVTAAADVIDPALVLAVARHESGFREDALNPSGAAGVMQMMPATAQHVLREATGVALDLADNDDTDLPIAKRLNDAATSAKLGAGYLRMLQKDPAVAGSLMKMLAAYNAGPATVANWQKSARNMNDPLLYLESIPYPETHNYVLQVMAHYWIYQNMLGERPASLAQLAHGQWPTLS